MEQKPGFKRVFFCLLLTVAGTSLATFADAAESPLERGEYLVRAIMGCGTCHTTRDAAMKPIPEMELAGGRVIDREGIP